MKKEERKQLWGEQDRPQCRSDRLNGEHTRVPHGAEMLSHWLRAAGKSVALTQKLRQSLKVLTGGHCHLNALLAAEQPVFFLKGNWSGTLPLLPQSTPVPSDPRVQGAASSRFQWPLFMKGNLKEGS